MCVNLNEYELLAWPSVVGRYRQCVGIHEICSKCDIVTQIYNKLTYLVFGVVFTSVCVLLEPF